MLLVESTIFAIGFCQTALARSADKQRVLMGLCFQKVMLKML
jgi:hypothetical protein